MHELVISQVLCAAVVFCQGSNRLLWWCGWQLTDYTACILTPGGCLQV